MVAFAALALLSAAPPPAKADLGSPDIATRQAIRLAQQVGRFGGERVWRGMATAPFDVLLIEQNRETLFCSPSRQDFGPRRWDPVTRCWTQTRARTQDPDSFGATDVFDENRDIILVSKPPSDPEELRFWITLMAHEHFHQLQDSKPWMRAESQRLTAYFGGGIGEANWSLAYPFPYARPDVGQAFDNLAAAGLDVLQAGSMAKRREAAAVYLRRRDALQALVSEKDWKYFEEQAWAEGVARWTQAATIDAYAEITRDPVWIREAKGMHNARIVSLNSVRRDGFKKWKRGAIYEVGAVEGEIAAMRCRNWKSAYWKHPSTMKPMLTNAC